jgi:hypothetical protein
MLRRYADEIGKSVDRLCHILGHAALTGAAAMQNFFAQNWCFASHEVFSLDGTKGFENKCLWRHPV